MLMVFMKHRIGTGEDGDTVWINTRNIVCMSHPLPEQEDIYELSLGQGHSVCVRIPPWQFGQLIALHEQYDKS